MALFWHKKPQTLRREQSLASRPVRLVEPQLSPTPDGGAKLTVRLRHNNLSRFILRLPEDAARTFEFDQIGLLVWNQCDGKTSVQQIIRKLARQYNISLREAEVSTVQFLRTLVKKGLLGMTPRAVNTTETSQDR